MHCKIAIHAAAFLLLQEQNRQMQAAKLMQLLYIADRENLLKYGHMMTHCTRVSTANGPVHSEIYAAIKGGESTALDDLFVINGETIILKDNAELNDLDYLSPANEELLRDVWTRYAATSAEEITKTVMARYAEWNNNTPDHHEILLLSVFLAAGIENARESSALAEGHRSVSSILEAMEHEKVKASPAVECAVKRNAQYVLQKMGLCPISQPDSILEKIKHDESRIHELEEKLAQYEEALTASGDTKAAYIGEFKHNETILDDDGEERVIEITTPWSTIKDIMKAIHERAVAR